MAMAIRRYQIRPITFWLQWTSNYPFWGNIESHPYFVVSENVVCETCFSSSGYVGVSHYFFRQNHLCHFFVFSNWVDWRRKPFWSKDGRGSPHNPNWPPIPRIFWWRTGTYFHKLHVVFSNIEVIFGWSVGIFPTWMGVWYPPWNCHRKMALNATFFDWSPPSDIFSDVYYTIVFDHLFGNLLSYIYIFWYAIWYSSSEIYSDILSDTHPEILPGLILWHSFWHVFWHIFWHSIWPFMIWHFIWHLIWHFLTSLAFCILKCLKYLLSCYFLFSIWHVLRLALLLLEAKLYTKSTLW